MNPAYQLLSIIQGHSENAKQSKIVSDMYNSVPESEREKVMANALVDGLNYGNWPWVNYSNVMV